MKTIQVLPFAALILGTSLGLGRAQAQDINPARATATGEAPVQKDPMLLAIIPSTGQALLWDRASEQYVLARIGQRLGEIVVRRLLPDRILIERDTRLEELPMMHVPAVRLQSRYPEQRGTPARIVMQTIELESAGHPEPAAVPEPAAELEPAAVPEPADEAEVEPARSSATSLSIAQLQDEIRRVLQNTSPYRIRFAPSGGILVSGVEPATLLHRLGLQDGDLVLAVNGVLLQSEDSAMLAYRRLSPGRQMRIVVIRNGVRQTMQIPVTG